MMTTKGGKPQYADPSQKAAQQCVHSDQPTQPNSTEVVQLLSRRDVLVTLEAAEELKLAISARPGELAVVPPCNPPPPAVPAVTS